MAADIGMGALHGAVAREADNDAIQELDPEFYRSAAEFLGRLGRARYDGPADAINAAAASLASSLASLLLDMRLEKAGRRGGAPRPAAGLARLLDEEKFILDAGAAEEERRAQVLGAMRGGRSLLLAAAARRHKADTSTVLFLRDTDRLVGADMRRYGPFRAEEIATVPRENAQALVAKGMAARVEWWGG